MRWRRCSGGCGALIRGDQAGITGRCPDCIKRGQADRDAAIARRIAEGIP